MSSKKLYLWLDDIRNPKPVKGAQWLIARNVDEAIDIVYNTVIDYMSLDHDLGGDETAVRFLNWMVEFGGWPKSGIMLHSANPVGRDNMERIIRSEAPEGMRIYK